MLQKRWQRIQALLNEFPGQFWLVIIAAFVDVIGSALLLPFFSLFVTRKFDVGLEAVGVFILLLSVAQLFGAALGGALSDKYGRKKIVLFGMLSSGLGSLSAAVVPELSHLYLVAVFLGLFSGIGGPARQAIIIDLLPEEKLPDGFAIIRVIMNFAFTVGPALGGLLAGVSYLLLFVADAVTSFITAIILLFMLRETMPAPTEDTPPESLGQSFRGYGRVLVDLPFMAVVLLGMLVGMVYAQMSIGLPVYLRDVHGIPEEGYGLLISIAAGMVVLMQFSVTRRLRKTGIAPLAAVAIGTVLYAVGFGMYGIVAIYPLFVLAIVIITLGEMTLVPFIESVFARFAKEAMRGRYMAIVGLSGSIAAGVGTIIAGWITGTLGDAWVWYIAFIVGMIAAAGYYALHVYQLGTFRIFNVEPEAESDAAPEIPPDIPDSLADVAQPGPIQAP